MTVNQAEAQELPCITVRLDTGHLTVIDDMDRDYTSKPPKELSVDVLALPPTELDPNKIAARRGRRPMVLTELRLLRVTDKAEATAEAGINVGRSGHQHSIRIVETASARSGYTRACASRRPPSSS